MKTNNTLHSPDPLNEDEVFDAAKVSISILMEDEFIVHEDLLDEKFAALLKEVKAITANEEELKKMLKKADNEAKAYARVHIKIKDKEKATAK